MLIPTTSGTAEYNVPGLSSPCKTWYQIHGSLSSSTPPLIILHGGPGATHEYLLPLIDLAPSTPLIFYDQIGNGFSTHLPSKAGDEEFWSIDLFIHELDNLILHLNLQDRLIDILGHSWGGMLAAEWAIKSSHALHLRRLILSNTLASIETYQLGISVLKKKLPENVQKVLDHADETQEYDTPEYEAAVDVFSQRHLSLARPWPPKEMKAVQKWIAEDPTVYGTMLGPSELVVLGNLRDWTCIPNIHKIRVPTLMINGVEDEAQDVTMRPFFEHIEKVKWIVMDGAAHLSHVDQREKYMGHVRHFLGNV
ncbi:hypothetical protein BPAE_0295g00010 [Botrytis paeoniae]|uniref:AB hydrolase-1 domain-containing protein n=1 Tax=Botrytis paeoniae TaxID=278948 RepID=A0A4Z1FA09_9HELO|nr:hypothetical protein BPAE_0295g00010 [Botrytis paeoniae]